MVALSKGSALTISSNTITPTHDMHHVTGGGELHTITAPSPAYPCMLVLLFDSGGSWTTAGNIATSGASFSSNTPTIFIYDPDTTSWYVNKGP